MFVCQGLIYAKPKNLATLPATQPHPDSLIAVLRRPCKTALPSIHRSPPKLTQLPPPSPPPSPTPPPRLPSPTPALPPDPPPHPATESQPAQAPNWPGSPPPPPKAPNSKTPR